MRIIHLLKENNKLSQMDIVNRLGFSRASVQRTMKKLVENGIIERKGENDSAFGKFTIKIKSKKLFSKYYVQKWEG